MRYLQYDVPDKVAYLLPFSDLHIGDKHFNRSSFNGYVDWVKETPNCRVFLNGDIVNTATIVSKSNPFEQDAPLTQQLEVAYDLLAPIKDKIIGCITGNHEARIEQLCGYNPLIGLCQRLNIPYLGYSAVIGLRVGIGKKIRNTKINGDFITYVLYFHHTTGGGGTPGGKVNRVEKLRGIITNADAYIGSHNHQIFAVPEISQHYSSATHGIIQQRQMLIGTGSFLDWNDGYSERMQLQPVKLGCPKIRFDSTKKDIHVSL